MPANLYTDYKPTALSKLHGCQKRLGYLRAKIMATDYTENLELILEELRTSTPATVAKLEALCAIYDSTAAFYAAFIVLCLQFDVDRYGIHDLDTLMYEQVKGYTYFEYMKDRPDAWERLAEVLRYFCAELKARCGDV